MLLTSMLILLETTLYFAITRTKKSDFISADSGSEDGDRNSPELISRSLHILPYICNYRPTII